VGTIHERYLGVGRRELDAAHAGNRPPARYAHAMAYDSERGVTVLFGGWDGYDNLSDTWEWDGVDWVQRTPDDEAYSRHEHAMAYDSVRGVTVLYAACTISTTGSSASMTPGSGMAWTGYSAPICMDPAVAVLRWPTTASAE